MQEVIELCYVDVIGGIAYPRVKTFPLTVWNGKKGCVVMYSEEVVKRRAKEWAEKRNYPYCLVRKIWNKTKFRTITIYSKPGTGKN